MLIRTRDFGEVEVAEGDVVSFVQPLFGFEGYTEFVFLYDQDNSHIAWLQSAEEPGLCFIVIDPAAATKDYRPRLPAELREQLGEGPYMLWLVMVVAADFRDSTVNLKSPVVVSPQTRRAIQVILEDNLPIRYSFAAGGKAGE